MPPIFQSADVNQTDGKIDQVILTHKKIQTRGAEYNHQNSVFVFSRDIKDKRDIKDFKNTTNSFKPKIQV
jgi:hypothetical protein